MTNRPPLGRVSPGALLLVDRAVPALAQFCLVELADWNTALYIIITIIMQSSTGDCHEKNTKRDSDNPTEAAAYHCGYSWTLDDDNYSGALKPKHYYAIAGCLFGVNFLVLLAQVGSRCNLFGSQADGHYIDAVLTAKQGRWYRWYARLLFVLTALLALVGSAVSDGGMPKTEPLAYWLLAAVALKEMASPASKPAMEFFEMRTESFKKARWAKRWFESCQAFESNVASAKLTSREVYVNEVFAGGDLDENLKILGSFVNMRAAATASMSSHNAAAAHRGEHQHQHPHQHPQQGGHQQQGSQQQGSQQQGHPNTQQPKQPKQQPKGLSRHSHDSQEPAHAQEPPERLHLPLGIPTASEAAAAAAAGASPQQQRASWDLPQHHREHRDTLQSPPNP